MKAMPVQAHLIASLSAARSSDGEYGLICFGREKPMPDGQKEVWVAVPRKLLPYLATSAIKALPQPGLGGTTNVPHVLSAEGAEFGVGPNREIILTVGLEKGATISFQLDKAQAKSLLDDLQDAVKDAGGKKPKASKGRKNGAALN